MIDITIDVHRISASIFLTGVVFVIVKVSYKIRKCLLIDSSGKSVRISVKSKLTVEKSIKYMP